MGWNNLLHWKMWSLVNQPDENILTKHEACYICQFWEILLNTISSVLYYEKKHSQGIQSKGIVSWRMSWIAVRELAPSLPSARVALASRGPLRPRAHRTPAAKEARMVDTAWKSMVWKRRNWEGINYLKVWEIPKQNSQDSGMYIRGKKLNM